MPGREIFRFGEFALDPAERRLTSGSGAVRLSPKAFDLLAVLVQHQGRLVTKDELLARVWPESFVEEGILTVHVSALRKALRDDTRPPAYIETGRGRDIASLVLSRGSRREARRWCRVRSAGPLNCTNSSAAGDRTCSRARTSR